MENNTTKFNVQPSTKTMRAMFKRKKQRLHTLKKITSSTKKNEIVSSCRHQNKYKPANFDTKD